MPILSFSVLGLPLIFLSCSLTQQLLPHVSSSPQDALQPLSATQLSDSFFGPYLPPPPPTPVRLTVAYSEPIFFLGWLTSFQLEIVPTLFLQLVSATLMIGPTHFHHLIQRARSNLALFTLPLLLSLTMAPPSQTINLVAHICLFLPALLKRALRQLPQIFSPRVPLRRHRFLRFTPIRLMGGVGWTCPNCQTTITDDTCPHCQHHQKQPTSPPPSFSPDDWDTMIADSPPPSSPIASSSPDTPPRSVKRHKRVPSSCSVRIPSSQLRTFPDFCTFQGNHLHLPDFSLTRCSVCINDHVTQLQV